MPITTRPPGSQIAGLTSLRFLAASAVVLYHTLPDWDVPGLDFLWRITRAGSTGVSLFFVLSGFILFHVYRERLSSGRFTPREFFSARIARVYPVYLLGLLLALPGFGLGTVESFHSNTFHFQAALAAPLLLQSWIPEAACRWNCPGWSLSAEMFFYLMFPIAALVAMRVARRKLVVALILTYGAVLLPPLLYLAAGLPTEVTDPGLNRALAMLRFNPMLRLPEFVFGILVARAALSAPARLPRSAFWFTAAAIVGVLYFTYDMPTSLRQTVVENGLYAPLFALLIVAIANGAKPLLSGAAWTRLGTASYALYIIHMPIWGMFKFAGEIGVIGPIEQDIGVYVFFLCVAVVGALLVQRYVEEPSRSALRNVLEEGFMPALRRLVPESGWPHGDRRRSFGPDRADGPVGGSGARGAGRPKPRLQFGKTMRLE